MGRSQRTYGVGGAAGAPSWNQIETFATEALDDPASMIASGGWSNAQKKLSLVCASNTVNAPGYQSTTAVARKVIPISDVSWLADFDPATDDLHLGIDSDTTPSGVQGLGLFFGLFDSSTVDASLQGCSILWRQSNGSGDNVGQQLSGSTSATTLSPTTRLAKVAGAIRLGRNTSGNYTSTLWGWGEDNTAQYQGGANGSAANVLRSPTSNWVLGLGILHGSATDINGIAVSARFYGRVVKRSASFFGG